MSQTDQLLEHNRLYAQTYTGESLPAPPSRRLAIVTCMDSRLDLFRILGLGDGEAHVIRNAGAIVTDDVLRSLTISQRKMDTSEIVIIAHDRCGQLTYQDEALSAEIRAQTGAPPPFAFLSFTDVDDSVRASMRRIREAPYLAENTLIRGFVFQHASGHLREVP